MAQEKSNGTVKGMVKISPNAKPLTAELAVGALFGMSLTELVTEISENRDGRYNQLYERPLDKQNNK